MFTHYFMNIFEIFRNDFANFKCPQIQRSLLILLFIFHFQLLVYSTTLMRLCLIFVVVNLQVFNMFFFLTFQHISFHICSTYWNCISYLLAANEFELCNEFVVKQEKQTKNNYFSELLVHWNCNRSQKVPLSCANWL